MAAANGDPETTGQVFKWWEVFGGAIVAAIATAFGGLIGLVAKVKSQDARMSAIEETQRTAKADFSEWLERVENKLDRLNDHFIEKGIEK